MARLAGAVEIAGLDPRDRQARERGDAVIGLLPVDLDVAEAERRELFRREDLVMALGFLQAENVRLVFGDEPFHEPDAQAHGVDVPSGEREFHGRAGPDGPN